MVKYGVGILVLILLVWGIGWGLNQPSGSPPPVILDFPEAENLIASPLTVRGEAVGTWFFEASFPVYLVDWDGRIIGEGLATAAGDWMTPDYVPFTARIEFVKPSYGERGALILKKDNPSGLPEHDAAVEIPIKFK